MTTEEIKAGLQRIENETDTNVKALLLAALVCGEFRAAGFEPVVVGGSAIEFYTDGAYMSGDTDICWKGLRIPSPVEKAAVISKFPEAEGTIRTWKILGMYVDLLGEVTTYAESDYTRLETPLGFVELQPVEDLIVERVFSARCWTGRNEASEGCAKKLIAATLRGEAAVDWSQVERIARLPAYQCSAEVKQMRDEVAAILGQTEEMP